MAAPDEALAALLACDALRSRRVHAVWLFGSRARGDARPGSDVDLAVLCTPPLAVARAIAMDEASRAAGFEIDVVDLATAPPPLAWEIVTTGRLVYELDEEIVEHYTLRARHEADDDEHRARMALLAYTAPRTPETG